MHFGTRFLTLGGGPPRIVTQSGSARGSYLETVSQLFSNSVMLFHVLPPILPKSFPKLVKILPRTSPNPPKMAPKSIQKASWSPSWTNALKKQVFERLKNSPRAPKSAQETPQTLPDPSQMEAKTLPNPIFERFFGGYFSTLNLHRFFDVFFVIFCYFSRARHRKYSGFSQVKRYILQNWQF